MQQPDIIHAFSWYYWIVLLCAASWRWWRHFDKISNLCVSFIDFYQVTLHQINNITHSSQKISLHGYKILSIIYMRYAIYVGAAANREQRVTIKQSLVRRESTHKLLCLLPWGILRILQIRMTRNWILIIFLTSQCAIFNYFYFFNKRWSFLNFIAIYIQRRCRQKR